MLDAYYITTAISYPNGRPHIGHAYEAIAADVMARFQRLMGRDVRFQTGTDEHGLKMAQKARENGQLPRELSDEMSLHFIEMCNKLNISHDRFIRTVEPVHHAASQAIWKAMEANGDLYLDRYEGWYSIRDEAYYDEKELITGDYAEKLSPHGTPVEWTVEESWFFRLSKYQQPLLDHYNQYPEFIRPESRRNEILRFVEGGLNDLSVSRTSFDWGVKVPCSENHVMYVWVDALTNYLTGLGYPEKTAEYEKFWPANLHLIGKDIMRFHTVYWPAFLMSANIPLPKQIFGHGFLLNKGEKMSKTIGNVIDPIALADAFGVDQLRYYLMREINFGSDGSYSPEAIISKTNAELANSFGNLAQRTLSMIFKNLDGVISVDWKESEADKTLYDTVCNACMSQYQDAFRLLAFSEALDYWMQAVFACNQYVDKQAPWKLKNEDPERMRAVLYTLFRCIRILAIAIQPLIPTAAGKLLDQIGIKQDARKFSSLEDTNWMTELSRNCYVLEQPTPLFPRLAMPKNETAEKA